MASIERATNGKYKVRWRDPDGKARARACPDKKTAQKLQREVEAATALGARWEPRGASEIDEVPCLADALASYARHLLRHQAPGSVEQASFTLEMFKRYAHSDAGDVPVSVMSRSLVEGFYDHIREPDGSGRRRSDETCRKYVQRVERFWVWAAEADETAAHTAPPKRIKMQTPTGAPTRAPRWVEMDRCISVQKGWQRTVAIVMRFTGLRVSQVMGLRWEDVDLERGTLRVRGELGKSRQERQGRIVPLSSHLVTILQKWEQGDEWLVASGRHGARAREFRSRDMARAWRRAGVPLEVWKQRPDHAFRKGFCSELKRAGADPEAVEYLVGHSLGLRGIYVEADALPLRDAVSLIPPLTTVFVARDTTLAAPAGVQAVSGHDVEKPKHERSRQRKPKWRKRTGIEPAREVSHPPHRF